MWQKYSLFKGCFQYSNLILESGRGRRECEVQGQIAQTVDRRLSCSVNQLPVSKLGLLAVIQSFPHFNPF